MTTATRKRGVPFKRLSKAAKEKAIEKTVEYLHETFDCDRISEFFRDELENLGYSDLKVSSWSLSYCQGDGVEIEGQFNIGELAKTDEFVLTCLAKGVLLGVCTLDDWDFRCSINSGRVELEWQCYNSNDFADVRDAVDDIGLALQKHLQSIVDDLESKLETLGYNEIDYQTSDEMAAEMIEANDYRFDHEGDIL